MKMDVHQIGSSPGCLMNPAYSPHEVKRYYHSCQCAAEFYEGRPYFEPSEGDAGSGGGGSRGPCAGGLIWETATACDLVRGSGHRSQRDCGGDRRGDIRLKSPLGGRVSKGRGERDSGQSCGELLAAAAPCSFHQALFRRQHSHWRLIM